MDAETDHEWISVASAMAPHVEAATRGTRASVLDELAERHGKSRETVRRMVKAYAYVRSHAKGVGLTLDDVAAPVATIETLDRLERKHIVEDRGFRRDVLLGKFTFRDLLQRERDGVQDSKQVDPTPPRDWTSFAASLAALIRKDRHDGKASFTLGHKPYSSQAVQLRVDLELEGPEGPVALFLSPRVAFSASRGKSTLEAVPQAVTATYFYRRTVFFAWDEVESGEISRFLARGKARGPIPLEVWMLPPDLRERPLDLVFNQDRRLRSARGRAKT